VHCVCSLAHWRLPPMLPRCHHPRCPSGQARR
jgi:hypothetical protein